MFDVVPGDLLRSTRQMFVNVTHDIFVGTMVMVVEVETHCLVTVVIHLPDDVGSYSVKTGDIVRVSHLRLGDGFGCLARFNDAAQD